MSAKTKFFAVATEGATTDGRTIDRAWIAEMAAQYSPKTYGARVNLEHYRGVLPDGPFKAYGDVVEAKAEEVNGKLTLFVRIDPTPELVAMNKARQKVYTSIEVNPKFADTSKAYLVGLAVTDSPASLGTEMLQFCAQHPDASPLASRKQHPDNLFTAATETAIEFEDDDANAGAALFSSLVAKFRSIGKRADRTDGHFAEIAQALEAVADHLADSEGQNNELRDQVARLEARLGETEKAAANDRQAFTTFRDKLDGTPAGKSRQTATGSSGGAITADY
ncbi:GPO family capsid scaffolding protein [Chitinimonas koreensis]|uniref:GPO family capsid scaffolding protein n=1 Tax=Chitinimonas koreensis TaxID=356302 RepID=UPI0003F85332|nr:GPO family capsid scaffolding protein [Chitinimonas koreensis]QNM96380.1 GPO family capsid scaffolding protein [Chitinimonas koreensis]